jgi:RHS repeat-associated protein
VLGTILNVTDRAQYSQPSVYKASQEINFLPDFQSVANDDFLTVIQPGGSSCDPSQGSTSIPYVNGDMGRDGDPADNLNSVVARDAVGFTLSYFNNDYQPINTGVQPFATGLHNLPQLNNDGMITGAELYNGNIASMLVNIPKLGIGGNGNSGVNPVLYGYRYDQLNRIIGMNAYKNDPGNSQPTTFSAVAMDHYKERVSYDPDGNILTYHRNGSSATPPAGGGTGGIDMDKMAYNYYYVRNDNTRGQYVPGQSVSDPQFHHFTNQLAQVLDDVGAGNYTTDIDAQGQSNYGYDEIGNLVRDDQEHITNITWTVYGKIASITKDIDGQTTTDDVLIEYTYDAAGNRITKAVTTHPMAGSTSTKTTIYVRDATGNVLSIYEREKADGIAQALNQSEIDLYGSSRLGMLTSHAVIDVPQPMDGGFPAGIFRTFTRGEKLFELSNHLGNVLVTVSDKKIGHSSNGTTIDYYEADVARANDYYPFGSLMPGRKFAANSSYRYGFNGKENDNDIKGEGNQQDYGMRIYDPRLGRFLSVDPISKQYPELTPYQFASDRPIDGIDLDGLEHKVVNRYYNMEISNGKAVLTYLRTETHTVSQTYFDDFLDWFTNISGQGKMVEKDEVQYWAVRNGKATGNAGWIPLSSFEGLQAWANEIAKIENGDKDAIAASNQQQLLVGVGSVILTRGLSLFGGMFQKSDEGSTSPNSLTNKQYNTANSQSLKLAGRSIIVDENLSPKLVSELQANGYNVKTFAKGTLDADIITYAEKNNAIVLTNNIKDFNNRGITTFKVSENMKKVSEIGNVVKSVENVNIKASTDPCIIEKGKNVSLAENK